MIASRTPCDDDDDGNSGGTPPATSLFTLKPLSFCSNEETSRGEMDSF